MEGTDPELAIFYNLTFSTLGHQLRHRTSNMEIVLPTECSETTA